MAKNQSNEQNSEKRLPPALLRQKRISNLKPFPKGTSGNPKGRRKGQRDYRTLFWIALEHIANAHNMKPEEVEEAMHVAGIAKALKGDFFFYQELNTRVHGKVTDKMDLTSGGKTLADIILAANNAKRGKTK